MDRGLYWRAHSVFVRSLMERSFVSPLLALFCFAHCFSRYWWVTKVCFSRYWWVTEACFSCYWWVTKVCFGRYWWVTEVCFSLYLRGRSVLVQYLITFGEVVVFSLSPYGHGRSVLLQSLVAQSFKSVSVFICVTFFLYVFIFCAVLVFCFSLYWLGG